MTLTSETMPDEQICAFCTRISRRGSMLPLMIPDEHHPMGMRSLYFCDKSCMAAWMDEQDRLIGDDDER